MLQPHKGSSESDVTVFSTASSLRSLQPHKGSSESSGRDTRSPDKLSFNPTKVRLKGISMFSASSLSMLQPHKGSSERYRHQHRCLSRPKLQPHKGSSERIRLLCSGSGSVGTLQPHKGSSESSPSSLWSAVNSLQPHKGSSESRDARGGGRRMSELQPHKGSSESSSASKRSNVDSSFNPTKVRLKGSSHTLLLGCRLASTPQRFV